LVFKISDTFYTKPESITGVNLRVNPAVTQYVRIYHPASEYLYPTGMFTKRTAFTSTEVTRNIHLGGRFGKREVGRAEAYTGIGAEKLFGCKKECLFKVGKGNVAIYVQPFHLVKEAVRPVRNSLVTVNTSGANNADGRLLALHDASLHGRRVGTKEDVGTSVPDKESVLHIPRRMIGREVEGSKDMPIIFYFRPFGDRKTEAGENITKFLTDNRDRMPGTGGDWVGGTGKVKVNIALSLPFKGLMERLKTVLDKTFERVKTLPYFPFLIRGNVAKIIHEGRNLTFLTEVLDSQNLKGGNIGSLYPLHFATESLNPFKHSNQ
jgi:hypothetical protein